MHISLSTAWTIAAALALSLAAMLLAIFVAMRSQKDLISRPRALRLARERAGEVVLLRAEGDLDTLGPGRLAQPPCINPAVPPATLVAQTRQARGLVIGITATALGVWLAVSGFMLGYPLGDPRTDAFFNEAAVGVILAAGGLGRLTSPTHLLKVTLLQAIASAWLIAAPFVVGYGTAIPTARANDVGAGVLGILLAVSALVLAEQRRPANQARAQDRGHDPAGRR